MYTMEAVYNRIMADTESVIAEILKRFDFSKLISRPYNSEIEKKIRDDIYKLYSTDSKMSFLVNDIFSMNIRAEYSKAAEELNNKFKKSLQKAENASVAVGKKGGINVDTRDKDWVRVSSKGFDYSLANKRMYINVMPESIHLIVVSLIALILGKLKKFEGIHPIQIMFKFPKAGIVGYDELIRADKMVVYYYDKSWPTNEILRDWAGSYNKYFKISTPMFTDREGGGVAFAYEPAPTQHDYFLKQTGQKKASFGTFMSLVIARYLYSWILEHKRIPDSPGIKVIAKEVLNDKLVKKHKYRFM